MVAASLPSQGAVGSVGLGVGPKRQDVLVSRRGVAKRRHKETADLRGEGRR